MKKLLKLMQSVTVYLIVQNQPLTNSLKFRLQRNLYLIKVFIHSTLNYTDSFRRGPNNMNTQVRLQ